MRPGGSGRQPGGGTPRGWDSDNGHGGRGSLRGCRLGLPCRKMLWLVRTAAWREARPPCGSHSEGSRGGLAWTEREGRGWRCGFRVGGGRASRRLAAAGVGICGHGSPLAVKAGATCPSPWSLPSGHIRALPVVCSVGETKLPRPDYHGRSFVSSGSLGCGAGRRKKRG